MTIINNLTFKAILKTIGRKSGKEHTVWAKAVTYNDMIYFSRRNPNSDWLKNAIAHPQVKVKFDGKEFSGIARLVEEEELAKKISKNIELILDEELKNGILDKKSYLKLSNNASKVKKEFNWNPKINLDYGISNYFNL